MFAKVLIADRGETAMRIARTCERLGIATVALHTARDAAAPHVTACDQAAPLPEAADYADAAAVVAAAQQAGADAIHPGCSPLAGDLKLARAAAGAGLAS